MMNPESILASWLEESSARLHVEGHPIVTLSYAQSLDGSIARERGKPLALSGPESMQLTHQLRAAHDAILVGIGTVQADNPQLTVRLVEGNSPIPVILDSRLKISPKARLFQNQRKPILAYLESDAQSEMVQKFIDVGATILPVKSDDEGHISLPHLLKELSLRGIRSVMVEGGARVIGSFLNQKLVDRVMLTIVPFFVGGLNAIETPISDSLELRNLSYLSAGRDVVILGETDR
jgi:riboflavin-specific deaminase-like protein